VNLLGSKSIQYIEVIDSRTCKSIRCTFFKDLLKEQANCMIKGLKEFQTALQNKQAS
ncbi:unnamed protein product, partial [marine sediment metagenome]